MALRLHTSTNTHDNTDFIEFDSCGRHFEYTPSASRHSSNPQGIKIMEDPQLPTKPHSSGHSDSSDSSSEEHTTTIHAPVPQRPRLASRKSSGTIIVPRDSVAAVIPVENSIEPDDARAMSPRRNSEDLENLGKEARDELRKQSKALQESLLTIISRIEAVKEEHDKLDNNNKFLQRYIGDLMSTSKITATGRGKK